MRDHCNFEMKWAGPDEVVFDISHTGRPDPAQPPSDFIGDLVADV